MSVMELKLDFVKKYLNGAGSLSALCREFSISRKTAYKWLTRYEDNPVTGLLDLRTVRDKRAVLYDENVWAQVLSLRHRFPAWGPRKLVAYLRNQRPERQWPSTSLIKKRLHEEGLIGKRHTHRGFLSERLPLREITACNDVWSIDFKGWFTTNDKKKCEPLTLMDGFSRFLFLAKPVVNTSFSEILPHIEKVMEEYGKPLSMRSDNGPPFGSRASRGLSTMAVWLLKRGIWPDKIRPGHPGENGRLERFHRTLNEEAIKSQSLALTDCERHLEEFRKIYNELRPHECHSDQPPASVYHHSTHPFLKDELIDYSYPEGYSLIKVNKDGYIRVGGVDYYLSQCLKHEKVGLGPKTGERQEVVFLGYPLGCLENYCKYQAAEKKTIPKLLPL